MLNPYSGLSKKYLLLLLVWKDISRGWNLIFIAKYFKFRLLPNKKTHPVLFRPTQPHCGINLISLYICFWENWRWVSLIFSHMELEDMDSSSIQHSQLEGMYSSSIQHSQPSSLPSPQCTWLRALWLTPSTTTCATPSSPCCAAACHLELLPSSTPSQWVWFTMHANGKAEHHFQTWYKSFWTRANTESTLQLNDANGNRNSLQKIVMFHVFFSKNIA